MRDLQLMRAVPNVHGTHLLGPARRLVLRQYRRRCCGHWIRRCSNLCGTDVGAAATLHPNGPDDAKRSAAGVSGMGRNAGQDPILRKARSGETSKEVLGLMDPLVGKSVARKEGLDK